MHGSHDGQAALAALSKGATRTTASAAVGGHCRCCPVPGRPFPVWRLASFLGSFGLVGPLPSFLPSLPLLRHTSFLLAFSCPLAPSVAACRYPFTHASCASCSLPSALRSPVSIFLTFVLFILLFFFSRGGGFKHAVRIPHPLPLTPFVICPQTQTGLFDRPSGQQASSADRIALFISPYLHLPLLFSPGQHSNTLDPLFLTHPNAHNSYDRPHALASSGLLTGHLSASLFITPLRLELQLL